MPYALRRHVSPIPITQKKAICHCEVQKGKSFGQTGCSQRNPHTDMYGVHYVTSTYSFHDFATKSVMTCPSGKPWTDCLDQPCTVDPEDPTVAICKCEIKRSENFVTLGGDCDTKTCDTGYWSGATIAMNYQAMKVFAKALGIIEPNKYCPGHESH